MSCVLVLRNKQWFELNIDALKNIWTIIEQERITGYAHRAPKSKQTALASQLNEQLSNPTSNQSNSTNKITNYINTSQGTQLTLTKLNCDNNEENHKIKSSSGCLLHLRMDKETGIITVVKK